MKKSILKSLIQIDERILDFLNIKLYNPRLSSIMSFFSHPPYWRHIAAMVLIITLIFGTNQIRWQIGLLILAIILSDQTCNIIKALVKRTRPDGDPPTDGSFWSKLGRYSFPSSHAADNYCAAVLTFYWWPYIGIFFYCWATIVSFSRVYLRSHFPSDVIVGGLVGVVYAVIFQLLIH